MAIVKFNLPGDIPVCMIEEHDRCVVHEHSGGFERETLAAWANVMASNRGKCAVDIGAYTGLFSLVAAKMGCRPVAIEPLAKNVQRIRDNGSLNGVGLTVVQACASFEEGIGTFHFNGNVPMTSGGTLEEAKLSIRTHTVSVAVVTVDALALSNVAAIKIDVEGHEPKVLRGAQNTLALWRPMLFVETLSEPAREAVARQIPGYKFVAMLDGRNAIFEPKEL